MTKRIPDYVPNEDDNLHTRLVHALTRYDRQQETRKGYNPYALGIYMQTIKRIEYNTTQGIDLRVALCKHLSGRLLDCALKACGLPKATREESRY